MQPTELSLILCGNTGPCWGEVWRVDREHEMRHRGPPRVVAFLRHRCAPKPLKNVTINITVRITTGIYTLSFSVSKSPYSMSWTFVLCCKCLNRRCKVKNEVGTPGPSFHLSGVNAGEDATSFKAFTLLNLSQTVVKMHDR